MRVTLSYFIEPSPGKRGWIKKYNYASHGLRFEVKTPEETVQSFKYRINQAVRDELEVDMKTKSDSANWLLGPQLRSTGSIHHDRWRGSAAQLAEKGIIAVYPVLGWWRERPYLSKWNKEARYSLIVTISTKEQHIDIYTPVSIMVKQPIEVELTA